ncbi:MAG: hypothetical protein U1F76_17175 [Candidatus Competibacteraceae bacterium]
MYSTVTYVGRFFSSRRKMPQGIKKLMLASIVLSQFLLPDFSYAAGRVFLDDFESGTTNAWGRGGPAEKCPAVTSAEDGGSPHQGRYMAKCNWAKDSRGWSYFNALYLASWPYSKEFLLRFWFRADQDLDHYFGPKLLRLKFGDPNDQSIWGILADHGDQAELTAGWTIGGNSYQFWGSPAAIIGDHKWHQLALYTKDSTGNDGILRVWVDGNKVWEQVNIQTNSNGRPWYPLHLPSNWDNAPIDNNNHIYIDEVEIYSDQGTGASGSLADGTIDTSGGGNRKLAAPKNLHVVMP